MQSAISTGYLRWLEKCLSIMFIRADVLQSCSVFYDIIDVFRARWGSIEMLRDVFPGVPLRGKRHVVLIFLNSCHSTNYSKTRIIVVVVVVYTSNCTMKRNVCKVSATFFWFLYHSVFARSVISILLVSLALQPEMRESFVNRTCFVNVGSNIECNLHFTFSFALFNGEKCSLIGKYS